MDSQLPMEVTAIWVAFYCIVIPLMFAFRNKEKSAEIKKISLTEEDRKQRYLFLLYGMPVGVTLGFFIHIPMVFEILNIHKEWYLPIIQALAAMFYIPVFIIIMGVRGLSFIVKTNISEKRKGISDGIFISFVAWQVMLFFTGRFDVFIPGFSDALHHMNTFNTNSTG